MKALLHCLRLGEEEHAGGVPVQPVDQKGAALPAVPQPVGHRTEGGALLLPLVGGGEQPRGLVDGQQIRILVEQGEGQIAALQTGTQRHGLAGDEGMVVTGDCLPIHQHLPPGEQRFDVVAALPLLVGEQKGKQGVRPVHREDGGLFWLHWIRSFH